MRSQKILVLINTKMSGAYITVNRFDPSTYDVSKFYFNGRNVAMELPPNIKSMTLEIPKDRNGDDLKKYFINKKHSFLWNNRIKQCKL